MMTKSTIEILLKHNEEVIKRFKVLDNDEDFIRGYIDGKITAYKNVLGI